MSERDFSRSRMQAAADQRRHAGGVVRRAERPAVGQRAALDFAGDRGDHRDLEELGRCERREDRRQPRRQHRFAGARRADHQQIVAAGRRDFERALGAFLALDVGEVVRGAGDLEDLRLRPREHLRALEVVGELDERRRGDDLDLRARPSRFRPARGRAHQALAARIGADRGRQDAGHRRHRAVEAELAQNREAGDGIVGNGADRRHQSKRNRQIVVAPLLGQIGGRKIDGDAAGRQSEAGCDHCGPDAFARFRNGFVRQADNGERRQARRDLHLNVNRPDLDALERHRGDALDHVRPCLQVRVAEAPFSRRLWSLTNPIGFGSVWKLAILKGFCHVSAKPSLLQRRTPRLPPSRVDFVGGWRRFARTAARSRRLGKLLGVQGRKGPH